MNARHRPVDRKVGGADGGHVERIGEQRGARIGIAHELHQLELDVHLLQVIGDQGHRREVADLLVADGERDRRGERGRVLRPRGQLREARGDELVAQGVVERPAQDGVCELDGSGGEGSAAGVRRAAQGREPFAQVDGLELVEAEASEVGDDHAGSEVEVVVGGRVA